MLNPALHRCDRAEMFVAQLPMVFFPEIAREVDGRENRNRVRTQDSFRVSDNFRSKG